MNIKLNQSAQSYDVGNRWVSLKFLTLSSLKVRHLADSTQLGDKRSANIIN